MPSTYEPIATTTLGSAAANITFSSIPATYTDLRLILTGTTTTDGWVSESRFNLDTSSIYSYIALRGDGTAAYSNRATAANTILVGDQYNGSSSTIPIFISMDIFSYAGSTYKTTLVNTASDVNGSGAETLRVGLWRSTAVINSVRILSGDTWKTGTTATLYGIKAA